MSKKVIKKKNPLTDNLKEQIRVLKRKLWTAERLRHDAVTQPRVTVSKNYLDGRLLAAGVAHEFNNILGAADGHAEWALESSNEADMREALEVVRQACARSLQITKSLQGMQSPHEESMEVFDLTSLSKELLKYSEIWKRKSQIHFSLEFPEIQIYGNESRLFEVLLNLVKNAFEACETSQLRMKKSPSIESRTLNVKVSTLVENKRCKIFIEDNGDGIPEVLREKIFQPFFTTKGRLASFVASNESEDSMISGALTQGSGLGLFLSRSIVQQMGGKLILAKTQQGTRFQLVLPII